MRFKRLFTVSAGEKVTEKALRRVLISSICSILICMTCLVSTTWAWFTVTIENSGNEIQIGSWETSSQPETEDELEPAEDTEPAENTEPAEDTESTEELEGAEESEAA